MTWYTFVLFGGGPCPARGPHKTIEAAEEAVRRFRIRHGHEAGTHLAAGSVRMVGPFGSRRAAQEADISDEGLPLVRHVR